MDAPLNRLIVPSRDDVSQYQGFSGGLLDVTGIG